MDLQTVPSTKVCRGRCQAELPLDSFGVQTRGLYGRKSECKKCLADKEASRRAADPEGQRAYRRQWWSEREWTPEERVRAAEKARNWYSSNKEHRKQTLRIWVEANRDAVNTIQARRRAKKAVVLNTLTLEEWSEILEFFGHRCAYCLRGDMPLTMDHLIPIARGGPHSSENVVPACKQCNCSKKDRLIFAMLNREPVSSN